MGISTCVLRVVATTCRSAGTRVALLPPRVALSIAKVSKPTTSCHREEGETGDTILLAPCEHDEQIPGVDMSHCEARAAQRGHPHVAGVATNKLLLLKFAHTLSCSQTLSLSLPLAMCRKAAWLVVAA